MGRFIIMGKMLKSLLSLLLAAVFLFFAVSCGSSAGNMPASTAEQKPAENTQQATVSTQAASTAEAKTAEPVKLTVWINGRDSYIGPDEQKQPQEEWYISKCFKRFEAANPGVTVEMSVPSDQAEAHQTFKAAGMANNAPDIANLWSGQYIFALKDVIRPIDDLAYKDDLDNMYGWDTVRLDFKPDGKLLGYPAGEIQLCIFLYNKNIIKKAGLDFDNNPPRTIKDFNAACDKIKALGVIPMSADESFPYFYCWAGAYWWVQRVGVDTIVKECNAEKKFADDKAFLDSLAYYNELWKKGYMNKDAATSADSWNKFLQGKAAMTCQVTSVVSDAIKALGEDNVGAMKPPEFSDDAVIKNGLLGGPGQCLVVSTSSKHPDVAVKLLHHINSKAEVLEFQKVQAKVPLRKDVNLADLGWKEGSIPAKLAQWGKDYTYFVDNELTPEVVEDFYKLVPLALVGKMTPKQVAEQLDKKAEKAKK